MEDIIRQCKKLYIDAFNDDEEFTDLIFSCLSKNGLEYICENGTVISMLFCIDVSLDSLKGKYVYGVVTNPAYRGLGKMGVLFNKVCDKYKSEYDFLCLKPMDNGLFDYYKKLGFECLFKKGKCTLNLNNILTAIKVEDINVIKAIRKRFLNCNYVEYSNDFYNLLFSYCDVFIDDLYNPAFLVTAERLTGKVKEVLGDCNALPQKYSGKDLLIPGSDIDFGMIKYLKNIKLDCGYLGFAMD